MKLLPLAAALSACLAAPAGAATVMLAGVADDANGRTRFAYRADLGARDALHRGSTIVIYDFGGYIDGSIFATGGDLAGSIEMVSALPRVDGLADDPTLVNLVFTFVGSPTRNIDGSFDLGGFGASTISRKTYLGDTRASTVRYDMFDGRTARVDWHGGLLVPMAVPEPAVWAALIAGFGIAGAALRFRSRRLTVS